MLFLQASSPLSVGWGGSKNFKLLRTSRRIRKEALDLLGINTTYISLVITMNSSAKVPFFKIYNSLTLSYGYEKLYGHHSDLLNSVSLGTLIFLTPEHVFLTSCLFF